MTVTVTMVLDDEAGAETLALLVKGFTRGELGVLDIRMQRAESPAPVIDMRRAVPMRSPAQQAQSKMVDRGFLTIHQALKTGPKTYSQIRDIYVKGGFSHKGLGGAINRWRSKGLIQRTPDLTAWMLIGEKPGE